MNINIESTSDIPYFLALATLDFATIEGRKIKKPYKVFRGHSER